MNPKTLSKVLAGIMKVSSSCRFIGFYDTRTIGLNCKLSESYVKRACLELEKQGSVEIKYEDDDALFVRLKGHLIPKMSAKDIILSSETAKMLEDVLAKKGQILKGIVIDE